jgi:aminopeptidase-like protein
MINKKNITMIKWAKDLFPLCRSLTGEGTRKTLVYFKNLNKEFTFLKFKSGEKVFDWEIPLEWNIVDAYIQHESGKKFCEFKKNNLHVVGYSTPIKKLLKKKDLLKNIYVQNDQPDSIPYVTSYYKKRWGFCISKNELKNLPEGNYTAYINSSLKKGKLDLMHAKINGSSNKEIFFSSYVCHPSMANNELSGPVLLNAIMLYLKNKYKKRKYTYRFVLLPETIGSIAYLSKFKNSLKKNVLAGYNLSCVGDERNFSIIKSPNENTISDISLEAALIGKKNVKTYSYLERGSDERQYCSPLVNLPLSGFSRSKEFPEYHTDKDNFSVVTEKGLNGSLEVFKNIIDCFETSVYPKTKIVCEPNLGKRNLYPTISQKGTHGSEIKNRLDIIALSNGKNSVFEISKTLNVNLQLVLEELITLKKNKIIK